MPAAIGLVVVIIAVYLGTFALNKNTPVPIEAYDEEDLAKCGACSNSTCGIKQQMSEER